MRATSAGLLWLNCQNTTSPRNRMKATTNSSGSVTMRCPKRSSARWAPASPGTRANLAKKSGSTVQAYIITASTQR